MRVLAYTSPARGHLFPTVPILLELQRRGHEITVRTLAAEVDRLRVMGFRADPISPEIESAVHDDYLAGNPIAALKRVVRVGAQRAALEVPDVRSAIAAAEPDLLLVDTNTWGAAAIAEASGGPWANLQPFLTPLPAAEVPPFGPGLRLSAGWLGRLRNRLLRPLVLGGYERALLPSLNDVRREAGATPVRDATDLFTRAPLTLYLTSPAFEYPRSTWPASYCFVGPLAWDPPLERAVDPQWLVAANPPVVVVATSSEFQDDGDIVRAALTGLADEAVTVLATLPAGPVPVDVPANARVESWLPHSLVLPHADVAVTHGGMGVTQKALAAGVPVVVVPWGRDQLEVGRRVERAGAGVLLPRRRLTGDSLRHAVYAARGCRPQAERLGARLRGEGGAVLAADRLEELAAAW